MRGGLRLRLMLAMVAVAVVSVTAAGLWTQRSTRQQFERFLEVEIPFGDPLEAVEPLLEHYRQAGGWAGVEARLAPQRLLFDARRRLVASTVAADRIADATLAEDGTLEMTRSVRTADGRGVREDRLALRGGVPLEIDGRLVGTLFPLPEEDEERTAERVFVRGVGRMHLWGIAGASLLALGIAWLLARRIVRPVERLTDATHGLAGGDLSRRVDASGRDEIAQLGGAFNAMAETIERNERQRRLMVSDVAHELRTPLTHLRCRLEAVQDGLKPLDGELLASLHAEIVHLGRLVDDLQELALAEAGRLPLHPMEFEPGALIRDLAAAFPGGAGAPPVAVELDEPLPQVRVDPDRLRQVLRNLVENARRHAAADGRVTIAAREDEGRLLCEVRDDGAGIDQRHLPHLFDRFYRTDPARGRETGGAGLGLAIVKQLVEGWGGTVEVTSAPGAGTRVRFDLPLATAA